MDLGRSSQKNFLQVFLGILLSEKQLHFRRWQASCNMLKILSDYFLYCNLKSNFSARCEILRKMYKCRWIRILQLLARHFLLIQSTVLWDSVLFQLVSSISKACSFISSPVPDNLNLSEYCHYSLLIIDICCDHKMGNVCCFQLYFGQSVQVSYINQLKSAVPLCILFGILFSHLGSSW